MLWLVCTKDDRGKSKRVSVGLVKHNSTDIEYIPIKETTVYTSWHMLHVSDDNDTQALIYSFNFGQVEVLDMTSNKVETVLNT